jgi:hypothetical protein
MTARKLPLLSPIHFRCGPSENTSHSRYPLLCNVTAYTELCLLSTCLETGCITPLVYCCLCVLLSNGCFCGSTILAWSKYTTISTIFNFFILVNCLAYSLTLKMEATCSSKTSVDFQWTIWRYTPEDPTLQGIN